MSSEPLKNDLFLRALEGEVVERSPVWMMRQAGRYLPEYMALREKYDFFTRIETPELAAEITIQPVDIIGVDAAILFSDILTVPKALGVNVLMVPGKGPVLPDVMKTSNDINALIDIDAAMEQIRYVFEAVKETKKELNQRVPLIGFAGSPWTIFCYMVQGEGSKTFDKAKSLCFQNPNTAHQLLQKITDLTIPYLIEQAKCGADALQIFDSWGGLLSPQDYQEFSFPYIQQIVKEVSVYAPTIIFGKGCSFAYEDMAKTSAKAIGVDWTVSPKTARKLAGTDITLQGNLDPIRLLSPIPLIEKMTKKMIQDFGVQKYIVNLGHGIIPSVPVDHAKAFVDTVKQFTV